MNPKIILIEIGIYTKEMHNNKNILDDQDQDHRKALHEFQTNSVISKISLDELVYYALYTNNHILHMKEITQHEYKFLSNN